MTSDLQQRAPRKIHMLNRVPERAGVPHSSASKCENPMSRRRESGMNLRLTFAFDGEDAIDIDLEDYH